MVLRAKKNTSKANQAREANGLAKQIESNGITPYLHRFLEHGKVTGVSLDTIKRRSSAITRFIVWCEERDIQEPQAVTKPMLERYQRFLYYYRKANGEPLSIGSQNVMLTPIKSFFKWLTRENYILYNPASEIDLPKKPKKLPRYILTVEEAEQIINQPDTNEPFGLRDRAILEVLYSTGMRRLEIVNLSIFDIDVKREAIWIRQGKGARDRLIPIGQRALTWLEKYQEDIRPLLQTKRSQNTLFLTDYGEPFKRDFLSATVKKHIKNSGLDIIGSAHLFRHACASHMLENGADIRFIQMQLGHQDLSTTELYTHVSIEQLKQVHNATHPAKSKVKVENQAELLGWIDGEEE